MWDASASICAFELEEHAGEDSLKHYRSADVSYVLPNACN